MNKKTAVLDMELGQYSSRYLLGHQNSLDLFKSLPGPTTVYLIDETVARLHGDFIHEIQSRCQDDQPRELLIKGGEQSKTLTMLAEIYEWLADKAVTRDTTIVAIGGGTILDVAGLVAATWRRGVDFVSLPTTLLAMVDAALGGKTGINAAGLKNPVGCFYPAQTIHSDCQFLSTLSAACWRDGLAEMIKSAVVGDEELFSQLFNNQKTLNCLLGRVSPEQTVPELETALPWQQWIERSAAVKTRIVNADFLEKGQRRSLNLGHTLGHALESYSHQTKHPFSHGQAISIGMAQVAAIATNRGLFAANDKDRLTELLVACGLPITCLAPPGEVLSSLLAGDKKQAAQTGLAWVLPEKIGQVGCDYQVSVAELLEGLE